MTSSLEGEGGVGGGGGLAKRWQLMTSWHGEGGGNETDDKVPSFYWSFRQASNFEYILSGLNNLNNIEKHLNWNNTHQRPSVGCFVAKQFLSPFTHIERGGEAKRLHDDKGGIWIPSQNDDVIYEQPLTSSKSAITWAQCGRRMNGEDRKKVALGTRQCGPQAERWDHKEEESGQELSREAWHCPLHGGSRGGSGLRLDHNSSSPTRRPLPTTTIATHQCIISSKAGCLCLTNQPHHLHLTLFN